MTPRRIPRLMSVGAAAVALLLGTAGVAWAVPAPPSVPPTVPTCSPQDLVSEHGASDITDGSATYTRAAGGGGTFTFTFQLAGTSCPDLTYRVEVYDVHAAPILDGVSTPLAASEKNGDGWSNSLDGTPVVVPSSYGAARCVFGVVRTVNAAGVTLDRAPDYAGVSQNGTPGVNQNGAFSICDGDHGSMKWS